MKLSRRDVVARLGAGALLAWPILSATRPAAGATIKKRFVTFFSSSGVRQDLFWPKGTPGAFDAGLYSLDGTSLQPLEPYLSEIIIPKGIKIDRGPGDSHDAGTVAALTGDHPRSLTFRSKPVARGESVDHFLAKALCKETPEKLLVLGVRLRVLRMSKYTSYDERGYEVEPLQSPYTLYDRVFKRFARSCGSPGSGTGGQGQVWELLRLQKRSILDTVRVQTAEMMRLYGLDANERQKLERMEEAIRSVELRLTADPETTPAAPGVSGCATVKQTMEAGTRVSDDDASFPKLLKLHLDLVALAFELDITRVITISLSLGGSGGAPMRWLQWRDSAGRSAAIDASHHNVTHGLERNVANYREKLQVIDRWNFEQFAYLVGKLKAIEEGGSTALDNGILWYATDVGDGKSHSSTLMPFIVAGRAGGSLKSGRYMAFTDQPRHQRLLTDFCHRLGVDIPEFGQPGAGGGGSLL